MKNVQKNPPRLRVNLESGIPLARQIADGLRTLLVRGELKPGDRLPSSRGLGVDLGVHFNTVAEAYRELEQEGWLELRRKQGSFVRERQTVPPVGQARDKSLEAFREEFARLASRYRSKGIRQDELMAIVAEELSDE